MSLADYPSTFRKALLVYPVILVTLAGAIGSKSPKQVRDGQHWRNATQQALKSVSSIHALLTSFLAARDVFASKWTSLNLIKTRSPEANSIIGLEAGYLIQDTLVSALLDSRYSPVELFASGSGKQRIRFDRLLLVHHVSLGSLLTLFLEFARRGKERGVFFVEMFLLMNASTPLLNLRWLLNQRAKSSSDKKTILRNISAVNDLSLVVIFFACRIGLIFYMLWLYGVRTSRSILQSYLSIPIQCKTGTAALLILNSLWWLGLARNTLYRRRAKKI